MLQVLILALKKFIFIYLKNDGDLLSLERIRKSLPHPGWAMLTSEAQNSIRVTYAGGRGPRTCATICCLPGGTSKRHVEAWQAELSQPLTLGTGIEAVA